MSDDNSDDVNRYKDQVNNNTATGLYKYSHSLFLITRNKNITEDNVARISAIADPIIKANGSKHKTIV